MTLKSDSIYLARALNSFSGFRGAQMPKDPVNATEFAALKNAINGGSPWTDTAPSWDDVVAKQAALKQEDQDNIDTKTSAYKKNGLTDAEIAAILN